MIRRRVLAGAAAGFATTTARAQGMLQRRIGFAGADGAKLSGTLLLPQISEMQYVPGVVLIAGSGPTDRDGNNPLVPVRIDLLKQIAEHLARAGIASLRYDKRGIGASASRPAGDLAAQERFFDWSNFVADAVAAHAELLKHDEIKPHATALLGHSEGGLLALAAIKAMGKAMGETRPYGLVLAGTPGRRLGDIVRDQIARNAPALATVADRAMVAILDTGRVPIDLPMELQAVFPPYAGPFLKAALAFDPVPILADLDVATLLVHGGADSQVVPMGDIQPLLDAMARRSGPGEVFVTPAVSHNLKQVTGPTDPGFTGPLAPVVAAKLASWLGRLLGA